MLGRVEHGRCDFAALRALSPTHPQAFRFIAEDAPPEPPAKQVDARGWSWHAGAVFSAEKLRAWLVHDVPGRPSWRRKGVLQTDEGWKSFNAVGADLTEHDVAARADSRPDIIEMELAPEQWSALERGLDACLLR